MVEICRVCVFGSTVLAESSGPWTMRWNMIHSLKVAVFPTISPRAEDGVSLARLQRTPNVDRGTHVE